jgi:DNA-binding CsgD family transcriptional regulator
MPSEDLLDVVHSAYDVDSSEEKWLSTIVELARPTLDRGLGAVGYTWDASSGRLNVRSFTSVGCAAPEAVWSTALATATPEYVERAWLAKSVGTASSIAGWKAPQHREGQAALAAYGIRDILNVNATNAEGNGCVIAVPLPAESRARLRSAEHWTRVAAHLAAAFRLRLRLSDAGFTPKGERTVDRADAVLSSSGSVEHAVGDARDGEALEALRDAVRRIVRKPKSRDSADALAARRALVHARWSLMETFEEGGRRYLLAMANEAVRRGPESLSSRERQVLALAALGHSNKLVAYELGLSDSTVRVLVARACRKLDVRSRGEAIACWRQFVAAMRSATSQ